MPAYIRENPNKAAATYNQNPNFRLIVQAAVATAKLTATGFEGNDGSVGE